MTTRSEKRPWLAVLLAFLWPGFGHVYLREWLRALVWFFLYMTSFTLLVEEKHLAESFTVDAYLEMARAIPLAAKLALLSVTFFAMLDAYWMAKRRNQASAVAEGTTCPHCGRDVDEDLDFCHWCTEPLPDADGEPGAEAVLDAE